MPLITIVSWLWIWKFGDSFTSFAIPLMIANVGGLGSSRHPMDKGAAHNSTETATLSTPLARHVVCADAADEARLFAALERALGPSTKG